MYVWFFICNATTLWQLALHLHQERIQVVRSIKVVSRLPTKLKCTPVLELVSEDIPTHTHTHIYKQERNRTERTSKNTHYITCSVFLGRWHVSLSELSVPKWGHVSLSLTSFTGMTTSSLSDEFTPTKDVPWTNNTRTMILLLESCNSSRVTVFLTTQTRSLMIMLLLLYIYIIFCVMYICIVLCWSYMYIYVDVDM